MSAIVANSAVSAYGLRSIGRLLAGKRRFCARAGHNKRRIATELDRTGMKKSLWLAAILKTLSPRYVARIIYVLDPSPDRTEAILAEARNLRGG